MRTLFLAFVMLSTIMSGTLADAAESLVFGVEPKAATQAMPKQGPAPAIVNTIQKAYESLTAFDAAFTQTLRNTASGEEEKRTGLLFFKKPHKVRWETHTPEKELLVVGEKEVWDYFDAEKTAYRYKVSQILESKTILRFISGQAKLDQDFWVSEEGREDGLVKLNLVPKEPEPQMVQAYVWVDPDSALLRRILLQDFYGNENEMLIRDLKLNPSQPDSLYTFTPSKDVEVFDNAADKTVPERPLKK